MCVHGPCGSMGGMCVHGACGSMGGHVCAWGTCVDGACVFMGHVCLRGMWLDEAMASTRTWYFAEKTLVPTATIADEMVDERGMTPVAYHGPPTLSSVVCLRR